MVGESMKRTAARVRSYRADPHGVPEQSASGTALHENQVVALAFKSFGVLDVEVASKQFDELLPGQSRIGRTLLACASARQARIN